MEASKLRSPDQLNYQLGVLAFPFYVLSYIYIILSLCDEFVISIIKKRWWSNNWGIEIIHMSIFTL